MHNIAKEMAQEYHVCNNIVAQLSLTTTLKHSHDRPYQVVAEPVDCLEKVKAQHNWCVISWCACNVQIINVSGECNSVLRDWHAQTSSRVQGSRPMHKPNSWTSAQFVACANTICQHDDITVMCGQMLTIVGFLE